jgi:hypothetical protein
MPGIKKLGYNSSMSIFRSGIVEALQVRCIKEVQENGLTLKEGEIFEVVLAMDTMYVIRTATGQDALVRKESFEVAAKPAPQKS